MFCSKESSKTSYSSATAKIVSEYDQEIPQSQTADNPVAPRGRAKISIFCSKKFKHNYVFTYNGQWLEIDERFVYIGTLFSYNGRFLKIIKELLNRPLKQCVLF